MADRSGNRKPIQFGDDGELLSGVFCVKCGTLNPCDADRCQKCGDVLTEQGPDLSKRLARIRRHASHTRTDAPPASYIVGQFETFVGQPEQAKQWQATSSKLYKDMARYYHHIASEMPVVPQSKDKKREINLWHVIVLLDLTLIILFFAKVVSQVLSR